MSNFLAIDTGGTAIKYALMDEEANIKEQGEVPTPHASLDDYVETLGQIYDKYADQNVEAVVMAAPGRIDANKGYFYTGGALRYVHELDLAGALKDRIPVPFCAENDAKAAALAEVWKGSMKGYDSGVVITLGTGIGGAIILGGQLLRGNTFAAGEFSPIPVRLDQHFKGTDDGWANINGVGSLVANYAKAIGADPKELNGRIFFGKVNEGDATAIQVLDDYCESIATGVAAIQVILDVQKFAFGGGISRQPILIETINKHVDDLFGRMPHYFPGAKPEIAACDFASDANMVGALYHYLHEYKPAMEA